jgi:hypothetical protein
MLDEKKQAIIFLKKADSYLKTLVSRVEKEENIYDILETSLKAQAYIGRAKRLLLHQYFMEKVLARNSVFSEKQRQGIIKIYNLYER